MNRLLLASALIVALGSGFARAAVGELAAQTLEVRGPSTRQIAAIQTPTVTGERYGFTGTVAYEGVEGDAYLEMWSVFPDGSRYFSRTVDSRGPMAKLEGTAAPRAFALPFILESGAARPVRLELNVVLPAAGHVVVRDLRFASGADFTMTPGAWWSEQAAGWLGAATGSAVGLFGALVGVLCSLGRGRRFVIHGLVALAALGGACLCLGLVALASGQPYAVWYPPLLLGVIAPVLGLSLLPTARRRFDGPQSTNAHGASSGG